MMNYHVKEVQGEKQNAEGGEIKLGIVNVYIKRIDFTEFGKDNVAVFNAYTQYCHVIIKM